MIDPRTPCVIGVAQLTNRPGEGDGDEPLDLWADVSRRAAADADGRGVLGAVESLQVIFCQSWPYDDPGGRLADRLGIDPAVISYSGIGGTTPQQLVSAAGRSILAGDLDLALICGGEALATKRRLKKAGERPAWSHREAERSPFPFEAPFHPAEVAHEVFQAWLTFPVFDIGRRSHLGVSPDDYEAQLGEIFAPMTEVAAANPYAWYPIVRDADELMTPTPDNRLVGYPYPKYTLAVMDVDMAGALVVASEQRADELGVPRGQRVYLRGWGYATDPTYVAEHGHYHGSPAMAAAGRTALSMAGLGIDDVDHFDLYSCFGSSLTYALDAFGLSPDDGRGVTVTGGLPFAGGPGSNYMVHSIATMVDRLRGGARTAGLVTGVGMHMTKHTCGVYSTEPADVVPPDSEGVQDRLDAEHPPRRIVDTHTGEVTVATYTVAHGRDGSPEWALVIGELADGRRCYARSDDLSFMESLEESDRVGDRIDIGATGGGVNLVQI